MLPPDDAAPGSGPTGSFADLMARLRLGDDDAAAEVYRRFVHRLVALASRQFAPWLRARADHEGVVQSAFKSSAEHDRIAGDPHRKLVDHLAGRERVRRARAAGGPSRDRPPPERPAALTRPISKAGETAAARGRG